MENTLKILSYNILDVELESNFVPRNMNTTCKDKILATLKTDGSKVNWDTDFASKYMPFHKGFNGINKSKTRELWGSKTPNGDAVNPNLMQILINLFDGDTATGLYNKIEKYNFQWVENRLERVYQKIVKDDPDIVCLQEYGNCKDLPSSPIEKTEAISKNNTKGEFSDEINKMKDLAKENEDIPVGSLADKLINKGYRYALYSYNPDKSNGDDGIAIFYKGAVFQKSENKIYIDMDKDLHKTYPKYTTQRGCGLLELTHRTTSKKVIICTTHIQTASNEIDKDPNINGYDPYKIRRGELEYIKKYINDRYINPNDLVIFCADFNLDLNGYVDEAIIEILKKNNKPVITGKDVIDDFESGSILKRIKSRPEDDIGLVTSYPTGRQEYIDYFFTNCGGVLKADFKEKANLSGATIPNGMDEPSDHIPILLTITFDAPTAGGASRRKKSKAKKAKKTKKAKKAKKTKKRRGF